MEELKPCPFCGGDAFIEVGYGCRTASVRCERCGIGTAEYSDEYQWLRCKNYFDIVEAHMDGSALRQAVEAWNRRAREMRLIDADDFIKKFRYADANTEEENIMCATVRRMIKEQPTSYDVDKVVEQLEILPKCSTWNHNSDNIDRKRAIEIVKDGGVNAVN